VFDGRTGVLMLQIHGPLQLFPVLMGFVGKISP
jgi:hypothetical protein